MSTGVSANVIYSDSRTVVVTMASIPTSAPWLGQTTYLIDSLGHTTAVLTQKDQPTSGVTLAPAPYTPKILMPLASATASNLPSGWAYEGCYNDFFPSRRVLSVQQPNDANLNVQTCVWSCYQLGYSISGLENHEQCFCGNAILNGGTLSEWDFDCNKTCNGDKTEICGGDNKLSIYSNRTLTASSQSAPSQTPEHTTAAPIVAPSPTAATSGTPISAAAIAGAVIAAVTGVTLVVALIIFLRRRIKRSRAQTKSRLPTSRNNTQVWPLADRIPSWEYSMKDVEGNGYGLGLKSVDSGSRSNFPQLKERYGQLQRNKRPLSNTTFASLDPYLTSPERYSPPQRAPARAQLDKPLPILKHPRRTRTMGKAQRVLHGEDEQGPQDVPAARNVGLAKKCVRFGVNQIREFGRSPFLGYGSNASEA